VLENKTPKKMFSGEKPEVSHSEYLAALDPSGKKGIFVGYNDTSKAYRIYIPGHRKVEIN
jgi:hypothetical protein